MAKNGQPAPETSFAAVRDETTPPFGEPMPDVPFFPAAVGGDPAELPGELPPFNPEPPTGEPFELPPDPPDEEPPLLVEALFTRCLRAGADGNLESVRRGARWRQPAKLARAQKANGEVRIIEEPAA